MITVVTGEIWEMEVEGILRPVGGSLEAVTPVSREIELRAGQGLKDRIDAMGNLPVGAAVITPAGELGIGFLIHVVVQSREEPASEFGVQQALLNGLRRAAEWGVESLALPPLGTGAGNLDAETSAAIMVPMILRHIRTAGMPAAVMVATANDYEEDAFRRTVERAGPIIDREGRNGNGEG